MICIKKDNCKLEIEENIHEIEILKFRKLLKIARSPENNYRKVCLDITNMLNNELERYNTEMHREDYFKDISFINRKIKKINKMKEIIAQSMLKKA